MQNKTPIMKSVIYAIYPSSQYGLIFQYHKDTDDKKATTNDNIL